MGTPTPAARRIAAANHLDAERNGRPTGHCLTCGRVPCECPAEVIGLHVCDLCGHRADSALCGACVELIGAERDEEWWR